MEYLALDFYDRYAKFLAENNKPEEAYAVHQRYFDYYSHKERTKATETVQLAQARLEAEELRRERNDAKFKQEILDQNLKRKKTQSVLLGSIIGLAKCVAANIRRRWVKSSSGRYSSASTLLSFRCISWVWRVCRGVTLTIRRHLLDGIWWRRWVPIFLPFQRYYLYLFFIGRSPLERRLERIHGERALLPWNGNCRLHRLSILMKNCRLLNDGSSLGTPSLCLIVY